MHITFCLALAILALPLAAAVPAAASAPTGFLCKALRVHDIERRYVVYIPRDYRADHAWPVIVFLNGAGECGTDGLKQLLAGLAPAIMAAPERWPFVVVFPQKPDVKDAWEEHDDMVMAMLRATQREYRTDPSRVYLTGLSQGGHGTWFIAAKHPDVFAAIAPICGYGDPDQVAESLKSMPIWCFHGEADSVVPVKRSEEMVAAIRAAGGDPRLTTFPDVDHNAWDRAYGEEKLAEWLIEHSRPPKR